MWIIEKPVPSVLRRMACLLAFLKILSKLLGKGPERHNALSSICQF